MDKSRHIPWLEKYRPQILDDVVGNKDVIERFKHFSVNGQIPNFILAGPPGVGKTTTILCLASALLGDSVKEAVLELNASNERGIDVVRNKIKMFAQTQLKLAPNQHKIVILDEADSMTAGAQQALRRTMEVYSNTTRFALACNSSEKIIEPIQSRCAMVRFSKVSDTQIREKLIQVCKIEKLEYNDEGIEALVFTAQGDMRQAINSLQAVADGFDQQITSEHVYKVCDEPHPVFIKDVLKNCSDGKIDEAYTIIANLYHLGYSPEDLIANMFRIVKTYPIPESLKFSFIREIGITQRRISGGVNSLLQFSGLLARLCRVAEQEM